MKLFKEKNYYELLEVPTDVTPSEIRLAYKKMYDLYKDDSIVTYSFFSEKERKEILAYLGKAYLTLIEPESRKIYDRELIELGGLDEKNNESNDKKSPFSIHAYKNAHRQGLRTLGNPEELKRRASQNQVIQNILAQDIIAGSDIKKIRIELKITLEEIAETSKVRIEMLRAIEEDNKVLFLPMVYMTGFLKSFARYLQVDENVIVNGFIKHMSKR